jgi:hypothetical protein
MGRERSKLLGAARGKFGYLLLALIAFLVTAPVIAEGRVWKLALAGFRQRPADRRPVCRTAREAITDRRIDAGLRRIRTRPDG